MVKALRNVIVVLVIGLLGSDIARSATDDNPNPNGRSTTLTGRYLVAAPGLEDPNFRETVIYLVHHDAYGAMGLVINRLMAKGPVGKLLDAFGLEGDPTVGTQIKMHYGGPVEPGSSLVLHRDNYRNQTTTDVGNHLAVSSADDVLADLAIGKGPRENLLILGYAGWAADQLENEITSGAWYVIDADETLLFDDDLATKYRRALALRGFEL